MNNNMITDFYIIFDSLLAGIMIILISKIYIVSILPFKILLIVFYLGVIGSLIWLSCIASDIEFKNQYRQGQIDALSGKIKYKKDIKYINDSTVNWILIDTTKK